jgi:hypothetical protein
MLVYVAADETPWNFGRCISSSMLIWATCLGRTREDDPANFQHIFGFPPPPGITVVHSFYRSPPRIRSLLGGSSTFYFQLRDNGSLTSPKVLADLTKQETVPTDARTRCGNKPPEWFAPSALDRYELWSLKEGRGVMIFRDKDTGAVFECSGPLN